MAGAPGCFLPTHGSLGNSTSGLIQQRSVRFAQLYIDRSRAWPNSANHSFGHFGYAQTLRIYPTDSTINLHAFADRSILEGVAPVPPHAAASSSTRRRSLPPHSPLRALSSRVAVQAVTGLLRVAVAGCVAGAVFGQGGRAVVTARVYPQGGASSSKVGLYNSGPVSPAQRAPSSCEVDWTCRTQATIRF